jgi:hypothetical protein
VIAHDEEFVIEKVINPTPAKMYRASRVEISHPHTMTSRGEAKQYPAR